MASVVYNMPMLKNQSPAHATKPRLLLKKYTWLKNPRYISIALIGFAVIGTGLFILARAATVSVSLEAESAALTGTAKVIDDANAGGGKALRFASASTGDEPLGPPRTTPLSPAGSFTKTANLSFGPYGESSLLDVYIPNSTGPYPLVVYIHGGGWRGYDKSECPTWLALRGFALACVNYRYSTTAIFPAQTIDNKMAIRWLRAHAADYNIWPTKIGSMGYSSGGHLAAMLGVTNGMSEFEQGDNATTSSRVDAVYSGYGPMDLLDMVRVQPSHDNSADIGPMLIGKPSITGFPEEAKRASPTYYIDSTDAPHLLHHGTGDDIIPWQQSQLMHDKLTAAGVDSTLELLPGAGHGTGEFGNSNIVNQVVSFFDEHLR